jgi:hypothetical protein
MLFATGQTIIKKRLPVAATVPAENPGEDM